MPEKETDKSVRRPLAKTVLAKLAQVSEPTRNIYADRLDELKPKNATEALRLLSEWEGRRAELALTERLDERERKDAKSLEARVISLARRASSSKS